MFSDFSEWLNFSSRSNLAPSSHPLEKGNFNEFGSLGLMHHEKNLLNKFELNIRRYLDEKKIAT